jgi:hypothetical protein
MIMLVELVFRIEKMNVKTFTQSAFASLLLACSVQTSYGSVETSSNFGIFPLETQGGGGSTEENFRQFLSLCTTIPRAKFTTEEDEALTNAVSLYGTTDWGRIALALPRRSSRQCRDRWNLYLSPNNNVSGFSPQEDQLLMQLVARFGCRWGQLSASFQGRTGLALKNRHALLMRRTASWAAAPHAETREIPVVNPLSGNYVGLWSEFDRIFGPIKEDINRGFSEDFIGSAEENAPSFAF